MPREITAFPNWFATAKLRLTLKWKHLELFSVISAFTQTQLTLGNVTHSWNLQRVW